METAIIIGFTLIAIFLIAIIILMFKDYRQEEDLHSYYRRKNNDKSN